MKRLFITELDTALGRRVTERFGNAKEYEIVGTLRAPSAGTPASPTSPTSADSSTTKDVLLPPYVSRICPSYCVDATEFKRQVLESDIVICALTDSVLEAEAAIKMLAHTSFETEKNFVLVSSMMTWSNTFAAQRAEELAEKRRERQELIDAGEEVPDEEEDLPEPTEEDLPVFTDDQYQRRVPHARYQHWRDLEHLTKSANSETLHTNIIFGGITYGRGEVDGSVFHDLFRSAWHAQPLPLFTAGNNVVPLIHLDDLANLVYKVGGSNDIISQRYILGVDRGNHTLGAIVKAINDSLGCGKTYLVPPSQQAVIANSVQFTVDLRTEPGAALEVLEEGDWVSVDGFVANIEKIVEEYKSFRKVTPIRSVVVGPPLSGKSTLAASLAKTYRVEHLTISDIIRAYEDNVGSLQNELAQAREARREAKKQAAREAELAEEAEKRAAAEELAGETAAARGDDDGAEAAAEAADADDEDAQAGQGGTKAVADDDDVSDIDFDEAPPLINDTPILGDGEDAGSGAIAPTTADVPDEEIPVAADDAIDPDEDEDERIAKFKEDIATARKVLQLRRQILYNFNPNATPANAAEADGAGDDAAAAEEGDGEGEGGAATSSGPPPVENPFLQRRFIDEALAVMVRWRLGQKDCRNQGYILDGFPKTVRQATLTFTAGDLTVPEPEELATLEIPSGEEGEEGALNPVDDKLLPERVIQLSIDPAHLRLLFSRAVEEPGKDVTQEMPSHDSAANFLRRLGLYQKNHTKALRPQKSVSVWWKSVGTAVEPPLVPRAVSLLEIDAARLQSEFDELRDEICAFLGLPHFYRPTPEEICEAAASEARRVEAVKQEALRQEEEARQEAKRLEDLAEQESLKHKRRYETVMREQQEAQLLKDMPAQDYLMTFVVPALTAGIEKTVQLRPEDPLDALAEYLFAYTARTRI